MGFVNEVREDQWLTGPGHHKQEHVKCVLQRGQGYGPVVAVEKHQPSATKVQGREHVGYV